MDRTFALAVIATVACAGAVWPQGLNYQPPVIGSFHALSEAPDTPSCLVEPHPTLLKLNTTLFEDREIVDFEKREISFSRVDKTFEYPLWQYRYDELDSYLESMRHFVLLSAWYRNFLSLVSTPAEKKKGASNLEFALPVQYPSWAARVLGKEPALNKASGTDLKSLYDHAEEVQDALDDPTNLPKRTRYRPISRPRRTALPGASPPRAERR